MIFWLIGFLFLFIILFFVSRTLIKNLYLFFFYLTKDKNTSIQLLTWILLPGIVVHEVSHMLVAEVLGVRTDEFSFVPEILENNKIKAGSLKIAKTDPVRQTLIGLAPILFGLVIIFTISHFSFQFLIQNPQFFLNQSPMFYILCSMFLYLLFVVSNTMFSSKKDLEAVLFPLTLIAIITGALWLGGFKISLSARLFSILVDFFKNLNLGLGITILVNFVFLGLTKVLIYFSHLIAK